MVEADKGVKLFMKLLQSARSFALTVFVLGLTTGFLMGRVSDQLYMSAAMVALTGYFARRNDKSE